jgi:hypothetical protein
LNRYLVFNMKKILPVFFLLFLSLTSCIEIVEEITLHNDQSGKIMYCMKTNQIVSFLDNISDLLDISLENQLKSEAEKFASKIKKQEGIDSITINLEGELSDYSMEFCFASADDLNNAVYSVLGYKENIFSPKYLKITEHKFNRKNFSPWVKKYFEQEGIDLPSGGLLKMVYFKTIIYYPREVKKHRGDNIELSGNQKKLSQKNSLIDVLENKTNVSIKSRY